MFAQRIVPILPHPRQIVIWCALLLVWPLGPALAQTVTPTHSRHADGRGMHWTRVATPATITAHSPAGALTPGGTPYLSVDSINMTGGGTDASVCANACFGAGYHQSTVPYYSLDAARNVTLVYNSTAVAARPVIFTDVHISPSSTKTLVEYDLQALFNGALLTFLNGDQTLRFHAPSPQTTEVRLAGQFDNRIYPTELDDVTVTVTAIYSDSSTDQISSSTVFVGYNTTDSYIGRGWVLGGVQLMDLQGSGYSIIENGDGSASWFAPYGTGTYLTETDGDFSILTSTGSGSGVVYTRTYPDSSRVQFDYTGQVIQSISSAQDTVRYTHNGGPLVGVVDPYRTYGGGAYRSAIALTYDTLSPGTVLLRSITEPGANGTTGTGRATTIVMNSDSTLAAIVDPDGDSTKFVYNSNKLLTKVIDRRGDTTRYAYDSHSWLLDSVIAPTVPIDAGGGSTTNQHPITTFTPWQTVGVPTSSTASSPATPVADSAVHATVTDPIGRYGIYTVNQEGVPQTVSGPLSQVTTITRDTSWTMLPVKAVYPTGGKDTMQYTANTPNLTYAQPAGDSAANFLYGTNGQTDSAWAQGALALHAFLHAGTGLTDSVRVGGTDSLMMTYTYNAQRRMLTTRDANGHVTTFIYDPTFGNVDSAIAPGGLVRTRRFDAFGRDTADFVTGATYWVRTQYDTVNRVVKTWHRGVTGDTVTTTYDALVATRVKTPGGSLYKTTTNAMGWPTASYSAVDTTTSTSYRYDASGRLTSWTNRRGQRIDIVYDSLNRIIRQSGTNIPTDTFTYSPAGLIQTMQRGTVSLDSTFLNVGGQPDSMVHRIGGHRYAFLYTYGAYGYGDRWNETITTNAGITFVTQADAWRPGATSLDSVAVSPGTATGSVVWTTNSGGDLTKTTFPVGAARTELYTVGHNVTNVALGSAGAVVHDSLSRNYTLDSLGEVIGEFRLSGSDTVARGFFYDGLGRLLKVPNYSTRGCSVVTDSITGSQYTCSTTTQVSTEDSMGYDVAGNRTLTGSSVSTTGNELLTWPAASGTVTYTYDADGNMKSRAHNGVTDSLFWSANNELDSVHSGGLRRRYEYNSAGQPVRRSTNGHVDELWLWNGDQLIAILDSAGTHRKVQYLYHGGTDQVYAIVTDSGGSPLVRYVQRDPMGNVTGIMRNTTLAQFARYDAWGLADAVPINTMADTNRLGWKGFMYEGDSTRLYFARNRWYDPVAGRFVSEDPIGLAGGTNMYTFAGNNPVNGLDPSGLLSLTMPRYPIGIQIWRPPPPPPPPPPTFPPGFPTHPTASGPGSIQWWIDSVEHISPAGCSNFSVPQCEQVNNAINELYKTADKAMQCHWFGTYAAEQLSDNELKYDKDLAALGLYPTNEPIAGVLPIYLGPGNFSTNGTPGAQQVNLYMTLAHEEAHYTLGAPDDGDQAPGQLTGDDWGNICATAYTQEYGGF